MSIYSSGRKKKKAIRSLYGKGTPPNYTLADIVHFWRVHESFS